MKYTQIKAVAETVNRHRHIRKARRVENNTIEINVGEEESFFFDMTRGRSTVYKAPSRRPGQDFNAPFDILLHQLLSQSIILKTQVPIGERILRLEVTPRSHYKNRRVILQLEFTGRHANAILMDEQERVIEALRHIDSDRSYRTVRPGVVLRPLPPRPQPPGGDILEKPEIFLYENYRKMLAEKMKNMKSRKRTLIIKKRGRILNLLKKLPDEKKLLAEAGLEQKRGNIILASLHRIRPYDKSLQTYDFDGNPIGIPLPMNIARNRLGDYFFNKARRARSRAAHVHIERENLEQKLQFYDNILKALDKARDPYELELLVPKQGRSKQKKEKLKNGELYWIEGYKIYVGRNARENRKLLESARSNDIWMHVRDLPGSHVFIRTDRRNLPESVLRSAAKLCVDFSTGHPGNYAVDYTRRKFVKIREGSHVEYDKFKTIHILKEGVEIRE
jgi:predicted ribosome quality control (RQC) complex YloA/Tae2 family protein